MTGSAPPAGWIHRQRAIAARRRPQCAIRGHKNRNRGGPLCKRHAADLPPPITRTNQERTTTMSTMSANTTDTPTFDDWIAEKKRRAQGEPYPMTPLIQYDSWTDYIDDGIFSGDDDGDAFAYGGTWEPQPSGTAVRVHINADTDPADAVRLLHKIAYVIEARAHSGLDPRLDRPAVDLPDMPF